MINFIVKSYLISILIIFSHTTYAINISNIDIPDKTYLDELNDPLYLNGAGTRTKYIFDIYIGALYLPSPQSNEHLILCSDTPKRIALYFLYDEVSREKLQEGWNDGFLNNNSNTLLSALRDRLNHSLTHFSTMKKGDIIYFDYLPGTGTRIIVNNTSMGVIEGFDFMQAVLKIWIGSQPAQKELKLSMMGLESHDKQ